MGQQQLLLIVLGTVIVGLAILAGITAYNQNNIKSDLDGVVHECMRLASDLQAAAQKPVQFGGLYDAATENDVGYDFATAADNAATELVDLGWETPGAYSNIVLNPATPTDGATITCASVKFADENGATIVLSGVEDDDITTTIGAIAAP